MYSEPCQILKIEHFAKIVLAKRSIVNIRQGSEYTTVAFLHIFKIS